MDLHGILGADPDVPLFAQVQADGPVHEVTLADGHRAWLIIRHEDAKAALNHVGLSKDMHAALARDGAVLDDLEARGEVVVDLVRGSAFPLPFTVISELLGVPEQDRGRLGTWFTKLHPRWYAEQLPDGTFRWTTPSGRQYVTETTRYPI